ncbi:DUF3040 domain-containing protein [Streptomyces sp. NBC_01012]|uniref:DUF3040 domain-containing protein n=1 Tax=Streptomyces sp. NBC_01012 TaxID=2903717 RepID=UPI00386F021E|nr:DUF3040 domain-containing protein [Streptomyces sp. NBC_01012]
MPHYDERLRAIEDGLRADHPERADAPGRGAPRRFRSSRTLLWLAAGVIGLVAGIFIGHGLLIAAGLVVAGMAAQLLDPQRRSVEPRRRGPRGGVPRLH